MNEHRKGRRLFQLIPKKEFRVLCEKWKVDKRVQLTAEQHVWALIMAFILKLEFLRELESVLGVARSTLSDANVRRDVGFFEDLCELVL